MEPTLNFRQFYGPFLWMGFNYLKATEPLQGGSLLFTTKFQEIIGTHLINLRKMKRWVDLAVTQWFWTQYPWIGCLLLNLEWHNSFIISIY